MSAVSRRLTYRRAALAVAARALPKLLVIAAVVPLASAAPAPSSGAAGGKTIGLVLTDVKFGLYQTPDGKEECPAGIQVSEIVQWKANPDFMAEHAKYGGAFQNRGPNGELSNFSPLKIEDRIPFNDLKTRTGLGVNLDGTPDGRATAKTCKHEKFTSPEGAQVDNQMARVLGCVQGWRNGGFMTDFISKEMETQPSSRLLVEISGVNDEKNDPSVEVTMYKGLDRIVRTTSGKDWVPYMSHRIDNRFPQYISRTRGRIVDGVLITDPIALAKMPIYQIQITSERYLRDMVLRVKLDGDTASGTMNGYEPIDSWWNIQASMPGSDTGRYSPASIYRAALRFADGYPDPKTKQCTALSVAYQVSAVRALIAHEPGKQPRIAMGRD